MREKRFSFFSHFNTLKDMETKENVKHERGNEGFDKFH